MRLALFDFDGTLTQQDMFSAFLRFSAGRRRLLGGLFIAPCYALYRLGLLPARKMRPIASFVAFYGRSSQRYQQLGIAFSEQINQQLNPWCWQQLQQHIANGDRVVVVSASLDLYLKPWCDSLGIELVCSTLATKHGRFTGRYRDGDCSAEHKVTLLKRKLDLSLYQHITAYGDTAEDFALLSLADQRYFQGKLWTPTPSK